MYKLKIPRYVKVSVPATTSNLGPGFDVLGMALDLRNELEVVRMPDRGRIAVEVEGEGKGSLPLGESNLAVRAFRSFLPRKRYPFALCFRQTNRIPLARGLGSSATARLAGLLAAAAFLGERRPSMPELVRKVCRMEGHPDNAVPAFFGGLCACLTANGEVRFVRLARPKELSAVLCVPDLEVSTEKARRIMPKRVPLRTAVETASRLAFLVTAFEHRRYDRLKAAMDDVLHQPYRKRLTPGMDSAIAAALKAGAHGAALSGSGPTVLALAPKRKAKAVGRAMRVAFSRKRLKSRVFAPDIDLKGTRVRTRI